MSFQLLLQCHASSQGLIQKAKTHIDCEKGVQINNLIFSLLCSHYVADMIKKTGIAFNGSFSFIEN